MARNYQDIRSALSRSATRASDEAEDADVETLKRRCKELEEENRKLRKQKGKASASVSMKALEESTARVARSIRKRAAETGQTPFDMCVALGGDPKLYGFKRGHAAAEPVPPREMLAAAGLIDGGSGPTRSRKDGGLCLSTTATPEQARRNRQALQTRIARGAR